MVMQQKKMDKKKEKFMQDLNLVTHIKETLDYDSNTAKNSKVMIPKGNVFKQMFTNNPIA